MEYLKVASLKDHPNNNDYFDPIAGEKWDLFLESINTSGIVEPLIVSQDGVIVSGHQRKRACLELGIEEAPCVVVEYGDKDGLTKDQWILKDLIETNVRQRGDVGGSELKIVRRVDALCGIYGVRRGAGGNRRNRGLDNRVDSGNTDQLDKIHMIHGPKSFADVCKFVGINQESVWKYKSLKDLIPDFIDKLDAGQIPTTVAVSVIAKLTPEQQKELLELIPDSTYVSAAAVNDYAKRIKELEAENAWYDESEGATSEQVDGLAMRVQELEMDNERLLE